MVDIKALMSEIKSIKMTEKDKIIEEKDRIIEEKDKEIAKYKDKDNEFENMPEKIREELDASCLVTTLFSQAKEIRTLKEELEKYTPLSRICTVIVLDGIILGIIGIISLFI